MPGKNLVALNKLANPDIIYVGQELLVPVPGTSESVTYIVQSGDTLNAIAQRYGTTVAELVRLNNLNPEAPIYVGQRIKVRA